MRYGLTMKEYLGSKKWALCGIHSNKPLWVEIETFSWGLTHWAFFFCFFFIRGELHKSRIWGTVSFFCLRHKLVFSLQQHCDTQGCLFSIIPEPRESEAVFCLRSRSADHKPSDSVSTSVVHQSSGLCRAQTHRWTKDTFRAMRIPLLNIDQEETDGLLNCSAT